MESARAAPGNAEHERRQHMRQYHGDDKKSPKATSWDICVSALVYFVLNTGPETSASRGEQMRLPHVIAHEIVRHACAVPLHERESMASLKGLVFSRELQRALVEIEQLGFGDSPRQPAHAGHVSRVLWCMLVDAVVQELSTLDDVLNMLFVKLPRCVRQFASSGNDDQLLEYVQRMAELRSVPLVPTTHDPGAIPSALHLLTLDPDYAAPSSTDDGIDDNEALSRHADGGYIVETRTATYGRGPEPYMGEDLENRSTASSVEARSLVGIYLRRAVCAWTSTSLEDIDATVRSLACFCTSRVDVSGASGSRSASDAQQLRFKPEIQNWFHSERAMKQRRFTEADELLHAHFDRDARRMQIEAHVPSMALSRMLARAGKYALARKSVNEALNAARHAGDTYAQAVLQDLLLRIAPAHERIQLLLHSDGIGQTHPVTHSQAVPDTGTAPTRLGFRSEHLVPSFLPLQVQDALRNVPTHRLLMFAAEELQASVPLLRDPRLEVLSSRMCHSARDISVMQTSKPAPSGHVEQRTAFEKLERTSAMLETVVHRCVLGATGHGAHETLRRSTQEGYDVRRELGAQGAASGTSTRANTLIVAYMTSACAWQAAGFMELAVSYGELALARLERNSNPDDAFTCSENDETNEYRTQALCMRADILALYRGEWDAARALLGEELDKLELQGSDREGTPEHDALQFALMRLEALHALGKTDGEFVAARVLDEMVDVRAGVASQLLEPLGHETTTQDLNTEQCEVGSSAPAGPDMPSEDVAFLLECFRLGVLLDLSHGGGAEPHAERGLARACRMVDVAMEYHRPDRACEALLLVAECLAAGSSGGACAPAALSYLFVAASVAWRLQLMQTYWLAACMIAESMLMLGEQAAAHALCSAVMPRMLENSALVDQARCVLLHARCVLQESASQEAKTRAHSLLLDARRRFELARDMRGVRDCARRLEQLDATPAES
ncbi:hypothetical protein FVE85_6944 [Porphyridium purpureum]|uniref:Anaphase-promoting complex subunit 5 n=1 Tax=Porphyridium purpureum TaxID=35688 RepID=A0A5J4Z5M5_PORPP|nr:hypothetical protein FVE85_6944 [Porphyridium purpureum]|eukprot:POR7899..scf295_1